MIEADFATIALVLVFAGILSYKSSYMQNRRIGYLSLLQIFYMVVIPGLLFPFGYSYLRSIISRPIRPELVLPDGLLVQVLLLSLLFAYGGAAIHGVTKMLSTTFDDKDSETYRMNRYFHLTFSHNLIYASIMLAIPCMALLELNHMPDGSTNSLLWSVLRGLGLGFSFFLMMYLYDPYTEEAYRSRWNDLKWVFMVVWVGFVMVLYGVRKLNPSLNDYQLLIPALLSLSLFILLSLVLVIRRVKRSGWRVVFRWKRLARLVKSTDNED